MHHLMIHSAHNFCRKDSERQLKIYGIKETRILRMSVRQIYVKGKCNRTVKCVFYLLMIDEIIKLFETLYS